MNALVEVGRRPPPANVGGRNGVGGTATAVARPQRRLPRSVALRKHVRLAALRWSIIGAVMVIASTLVTELSRPSSGACARSFDLLAVWAWVMTVRVCIGGLTRLVLVVLWDETRDADMQHTAVFVLSRFEFSLLLLSILWTTIGWM